MGHSSSSVSKPSSKSALARQKRAKERQSKKRKCVQELFKEMNCENEMNIIGEDDGEKENFDVETSAMEETEETRSLAYTSIAIQTDLSMQDIEELENLKQSQEAGNSVLSKSWFEADEERVKFYTGLTAMSVMMAVFDLISPALPERNSATPHNLQASQTESLSARLGLPIWSSCLYCVTSVPDLSACNVYIYGIFSEMARKRGTETDIASLFQREVFFVCYILFTAFSQTYLFLV